MIMKFQSFKRCVVMVSQFCQGKSSILFAPRGTRLLWFYLSFSKFLYLYILNRRKFLYIFHILLKFINTVTMGHNHFPHLLQQVEYSIMHLEQHKFYGSTDHILTLNIYIFWAGWNLYIFHILCKVHKCSNLISTSKWLRMDKILIHQKVWVVIASHIC